ncbi:MAG: hypothetical protein AAGI70_14815 [Pseudomonadota bacterium]
MAWLEALSYIVTILGFPIAIWVFLAEERRRRANEAAELHRGLSEEYDNFLRLALENSDLLLLQHERQPPALSDEQTERKEILLRMLVSLFEKAFIILYSDAMDEPARRRWQSWEDDMEDWLARPDFRALLPWLLEGEDDAFSRYITGLAETVSPAERPLPARDAGGT